MGGTRKSKAAARKIIPIRALDHHLTKGREKDLFAQWLILPRGDRVPKTQNELAVELGVSPQVLGNWKRDQSFMRAVYRASGRDIKLDWLQPIMERQYHIATGGSQKPSEATAAAKFLVGVMEKAMAMEDVIEDANRSVEDMTLDELYDALDEVKDMLDDRVDAAGTTR